MNTVNLYSFPLADIWSDEDSTLRTRDAYVLHSAIGTSSTAVAYFEVEPGAHIGRHTHSAEELVLILEGTVDFSVDDEQERLSAGTIVVAPALVPHDLRNVGSETVRAVGFFPSAAVLSIFDQVLMPGATRLAGTPRPES